MAATFVFMSNVSSFTTPYLMGGNAPKMLGIALYDQFNRYMDYNRSAALSVIMFLICSVSAAVYIYTNLKEMIGRNKESEQTKDIYHSTFRR